MKYRGSISGLVRFAKSAGKTHYTSLLKRQNEKNGTSVCFGQVINIKNIIANATHYELFNKDGTERIFTDRILIFTISRMIKKEKEKLKSVNSPSTGSKSIRTVRK